MSTTQTNTPAADDTDARQCTDTQTELFDTEVFHQEADDALPEDIQRAFEIPTPSPIDLLDIPVERINELRKMPWESVSVPSTTPQWSGTIKREVLEIVIDHLRSIISEVKIQVTREGWYISVVDPKNVCMYEIWIDADDFYQYDCEQTGTLGINIDRFEDTLSNATNKFVEIDAVDETDTLHVESGIAVVVDLIDPDSLRQCPDIPDIDTTQTMTIPGIDLRSVIRRLNDYSDHLCVSVMDDLSGVRLKADGDVDHGEKVYSTPADIESISTTRAKVRFDLSVDAAVQSTFSQDYLKSLFKHTTKTTVQEDYTLIFGDEMPIQIQTEFDDYTNSHLNYTLAPRIES